MISPDSYTYDLPPEKIAAHPLAQRDESRLLVYNHGSITHSVFKSVTDFLPEKALIVFNDTKVIPARITFQKETGASIEIFLLNPVKPGITLAEAMAATSTTTWHCTIGNLKRWKNKPLTKQLDGTVLTASLVDRVDGIVEFTWTGASTFAEVVTKAGVTPLPPYIKRSASAEDITRYQTVYSHYEGAVAAPTAGLHFTDAIVQQLEQKGFEKDFVTLHVSAGTFLPITTTNVLEHTMHSEQVVVTEGTIERLINTNRPVVAVGTTSMRTLESLYWFGVALLNNPESVFNIHQDDPYQNRILPDKSEALHAVRLYMSKHALTTLTGSTSIFIRPGYAFKICNALITNFHLPGSTLILLVAAFIGDDWKNVYTRALENEYRFLSYGDSSLLIP